ncbi:MAG: ABC transporter substrate-binding protein [Symploca sp. SIO2E9]|nr:ABC transporter substrate-binding protein [Symploca sp. SIO2E9]
MSLASNSNYEYKVGGIVPLNNQTYVKRQADDDLYYWLKSGDFCYVLNSRQMGKSSLLLRTMRKLENDDFACVKIDVSGDIGTTIEQPNQWYDVLVEIIADSFGLDFITWRDNYQSLSLLKRLSKFIENFLLAEINHKIVIFVDEIDSVLGLKFKIDDFFTFVRYCYNQRAYNPEYNRLTFALFGVARLSDLIEDKQRTPFNIGREIALDGFQLREVEPLAKGLEDKVDNPQTVLKEILAWTGGQPFLTQKLCKLVLRAKSPINSGNEVISIEQLVQLNIVDNWESQDEPEHLRTIRDRIFKNEKSMGRLLGLYQQILQQGEITADDSPEQMELRLSGLVVKCSDKSKPPCLKVYNHIYQDIFNQDWIKKELENLRPYGEYFTNWLDSNCNEQWLLRGDTLQESLEWKEGKNLSYHDYQFLSASQELEKRETQIAFEQERQANRWKLATALSFALGITTLFGGGLLWQQFIYCPAGEERVNGTCFKFEASSGEIRLFVSNQNSALIKGIKYFNLGDYPKAINFFRQAVDSAPNNPVPQIYLNNAQARQQGNPFKLAVVVPVENEERVAQETLRGAADAQTKFNKANGLNSRLLEIVIVNDANKPDIASKVAQLLVKKYPGVLGVIGHNSSDVSKAALAEYEKVSLAMVSPSSASTYLKSPVFFRTVPSNYAAAEKLAKYAKNTLGIDKVVIFYNPNSIYSDDLKKLFEKEFTDLGGSIVQNFDMTNSALDAEAQIKRIVNQDQAKALVLIPSVEITSVAILITKINAQLPQQQRLQLLGGATLYSSKTLREGGSAVDGLTLVVPWYDQNSAYAKAAKERWKETIGWRTAASYDATWAFIKALSINASKNTVIENLESLELSCSDTSGEKLKFWADGNPDRESRLVQVDRNAPAPHDSGFGFKPIEDSNSNQSEC